VNGSSILTLAITIAMKPRSSSSPATAAMPAADAPSIPVIRLFDQRDILFLRSAPEYNRRMETGFRCRRCRIFRAYLRGVRAEFQSARSELETVRAESPKDYRQLAPMVLRCRVRFAWAMIPAYLSLFRYRWGLGGSRLGPVVQRLDEVRGEMLRFIPESTDLRH
jgi:hypothetical protein